MSKKFLVSKTTATGVGAILVAAGSYLAGEIDIATAVQSGVGALMMIFLRMGVEKQP